MESYDLVIVGSGAGLNVLNYGLQMGLKCALVEDTKLGATCLTRGCIPSKVLVHPADLIREAERAYKVGIKFKVENIDWELIGKRKPLALDRVLTVSSSGSETRVKAQAVQATSRLLFRHVI